jgi:hypothetical protein
MKKDFTEKSKFPLVMMEREYLKAWKIFKEQSEQFFPIIEDLVNSKGQGDAEGSLYALQGLNSIRFDAPQLREKIVDNALKAIDTAKVSQEAIIEGLKGLALSSSKISQQD